MSVYECIVFQPPTTPHVGRSSGSGKATRHRLFVDKVSVCIIRQSIADTIEGQGETQERKGRGGDGQLLAKGTRRPRIDGQSGRRPETTSKRSQNS
jgi:hypothetical protein